MMLLAQTMPAGANGLETLTTEQHVMLAYGVAIALLWGYAAWVWLATRREAGR